MERYNPTDFSIFENIKTDGFCYCPKEEKLILYNGEIDKKGKPKKIKYPICSRCNGKIKVLNNVKGGKK